jgi:hypothetical protein
MSALQRSTATVSRSTEQSVRSARVAAIKAQVDPREIVPTWSPALDGFRARRGSSLLY